jgi:AraC-like DNA-binding protein
MGQSIPIITQFLYAIRVHNQTGFRLRQNGRESTVLILPLRGRIRFTQGERIIIADAQTPVYVPRGAAYLNECLEEADSLLFNICDTNRDTQILPLAAVVLERAHTIFTRICVLQARQSNQNVAETLSLLYRLVRELYREEAETGREALLEPALELAALHFADPSLSVRALAEACHISEVYLTRLFKEERSTTPFAYLTSLRMERAKELLHEQYPIGEVARQVGYSDIYQFSRAFKKQHGQAPNEYRKRHR